MLALRRPDTCTSCGNAVPAGTRAQWDPARRTVTCLSCLDAAASDFTLASDVVPQSKPSDQVVAADKPASSVEERVGQAGGSAQREHDRRTATRDQTVRARHPRIGGLLLAMFDDPTSTKVWEQGAEGERRVGKRLEELRAADVFVLHDRRLPRSRANVDHLVVCASGVFVIDTKRYKRGPVERRGSGSFLRPGPDKLYVGGRDKTTLVDGMFKQTNAVHQIVDPFLGGRLDLVVPVLCFVDTEWKLFAKPFVIDGVHVTTPKRLSKQLQADGPISPGDVETIGTELKRRLPPA